MSSLRLLLTFSEAAKQQSFSGAARELGLTPSAVAKSIARLEQELGLRLFQRTTRRIALTAEGEALQARCRRVIKELEEVETLAADLRGLPTGLLRLDMPISYGKLVVLPLLAELTRAYPQLRLDLRLSDKYSDVVGEGLDAAIRVGHLHDSALVARPFDVQRLGVYGAPSYFVRRGRPARPADLAAHDCAVFRMPTSGRDRPWQFEEDGTALELHPVVKYHVNDGEGLIALAAAGLALVQTPDYMARSALKEGALVEVLGEYRTRPLPISVVYPSARHVPLRLRLVIDCLLQAGVNPKPGAQ
jgi:LysR family transcriptional regulator, regulator for bpeEF and oprC